jgi:hypothetical protein
LILELIRCEFQGTTRPNNLLSISTLTVRENKRGAIDLKSAKILIILLASGEKHLSLDMLMEASLILDGKQYYGAREEF